MIKIAGEGSRGQEKGEKRGERRDKEEEEKKIIPLPISRLQP